MVWAAFCAETTLAPKFVSSRMNSTEYQETLASSLLPFLEENKENRWVFQQDNAAIHTSRMTSAWFSEKNVTCLDWPALSPDLNPMENLWGILVYDIYAHGTQYDSIADLKGAIMRAWNQIPLQMLRNLVNTMPHRIAAVIESKGDKTKY